jgi:hypothetical protein
MGTTVGGFKSQFLPLKGIVDKKIRRWYDLKVVLKKTRQE